jgi:TPR repeat protein
LANQKKIEEEKQKRIQEEEQRRKAEQLANQKKIEEENIRSTEALFQKGLSYHLGGTGHDLKSLIKHYRIFFYPCVVNSIVSLGSNEFKSSVVSLVKTNEAIRYYKMAVDQGHLEAMFLLGLSYHCDTLVKDANEAIRYYLMAVEKGHIEAMFCLGRCYEQESSVKNYNETIRYYKMAIEKGHDMEAMVNLGLFFRDNSSVQNKSEAFRYLKMASDTGEWNARQIFANFMNSYGK